MNSTLAVRVARHAVELDELADTLASVANDGKVPADVLHLTVASHHLAATVERLWLAVESIDDALGQSPSWESAA